MTRMRRVSFASSIVLAAMMVIFSGGYSFAATPASGPAADLPAVPGRPLTEGRYHVGMISSRGIDKCYECLMGNTSLIIVPEWAARVSKLDFGWGNVVFNDPKVDGKVLKPEEAWAPWDGNATDLVQRIDGKMKNQWKGLWLHPYTMVEAGPVKEALPVKMPIELTWASGPAAQAGLKMTKQYALMEDGKALRYIASIHNLAASSSSWTVWERLLVPGGPGAYAICPLKKGDAYKDGYIFRDNTAADPADHVQVAGDYLVMRAGTAKGAGLAAQLSRRWMASVSGRHALLMTYAGVDDKARYPHYSGANAVFWVAPNNIELEPLSPEVELPVGGAYGFTQVWFGLDMPDGLAPADHVAVGKWLDEQAKDKVGRLGAAARTPTQPATAP